MAHTITIRVDAPQYLPVDFGDDWEAADSYLWEHDGWDFVVTEGSESFAGVASDCASWLMEHDNKEATA